MAGLMVVLGVSVFEAVGIGVVPFLMGDALKAGLAGLLLPGPGRSPTAESTGSGTVRG